MARKNRTPEENARREKIRELLQMACLIVRLSTVIAGVVIAWCLLSMLFFKDERKVANSMRIYWLILQLMPVP